MYAFRGSWLSGCIPESNFAAASDSGENSGGPRSLTAVGDAIRRQGVSRDASTPCRLREECENSDASTCERAHDGSGAAILRSQPQRPCVEKRCHALREYPQLVAAAAL